MSKRRKLFGFIVGTAAAWTAAVKPRIWGKPDLSEVRRYDYARRGLYNSRKGIPENSLAAIRSAIEHGYGVALDVRISRDGVPVLFHDERTYRLTGLDGTIENTALEELGALRLDGTEEIIPTLGEALELINARVPVLVQLHVCEGNVEALCDRVCEVLDAYDGVFVLQAFDPRVLTWFRRQRNEYIRSQLVDYGYRSGQGWKERLWAFAAMNLFMNWFTEPDLIACSRTSRFNPSVWICRILYRTLYLEWPVQTMEEYELAKIDGSIAVFEDIEP